MNRSPDTAPRPAGTPTPEMGATGQDCGELAASGSRRIRVAVFAKGEPELRALQADADAGRPEDELRELEKEFLARRFGIPSRRVAILRQVHGDRVVPVDGASLTRGPPRLYFDEGDALYTTEPGVLLVIRTADCLPLFFEFSLTTAAEARTVAGIVHAGWRGLAAGVIYRALTAALRELYAPTSGYPAAAADGGVLRGRLRIGPCIGVDAYEVGDEVARHFGEKRALPGSDKFLLDLSANARLEIERALNSHAREFGLDFAGLAAACETHGDFEDCTSASNDRYFSHRRGDRGRNLNTILIEE